MATTNYYSVNGQIIGEKTVGSNRVDYLTDALGSVTATVDQSANVVNTYRYKPYGAQLAKTGAGSDPAFRWVGSQGYRQTGKQFSDVYIRRRHYSSELGRWTTKDPSKLEGPGSANEPLNWYGYARANPLMRIDPTGLRCKYPKNTIQDHDREPDDPVTTCHLRQGCMHDLCWKTWSMNGVVSTLGIFFDYVFPPLLDPTNETNRRILFWALACLPPGESKCDESAQNTFTYEGAVLYPKGWYQIVDAAWTDAYKKASGWLNRSRSKERCAPDLNTQVALVIAWDRCGSRPSHSILSAIGTWDAVDGDRWRHCLIDRLKYFGIDVPKEHQEKPSRWLATLKCPGRRNVL